MNRSSPNLFKKKGGPDKFSDEKSISALISEWKKQTPLNCLASGPPEGLAKSTIFGQGELDLKEIIDSLKVDLDETLENSKQFFYQKFEEQKNQIIQETKKEFRHESDRIIERVLSGPYDRIYDKVSSIHYLIISLWGIL